MWSKEKIKQFERLKSEGKTNSEIAKFFGCTANAISVYTSRQYNKKRSTGKPTKDHWNGCEEDCDNCTYNDCVKPTKLCR